MSTVQINLVDRVLPRTVVGDIALVVGGALLTALSAQVLIPMYPVPMTLQTFAVLLIAASMGTVRAIMSMSLYISMGAFGLPVFAGAKALSAVLPTAGYLVGFLAASIAVGLLASRGLAKKPISVAFSFAIGSVLIYIFGAGWLMLGLGLSFEQALAGGVIPFLIGDVVKAAAAAALLPMAWKLIR